MLPESYNVEKVISWRQRAGGIELLIAREGDDVDGWTWEPLDNIPERFVRAFHAQRQRLPPSFFYVVTKMRDRIGFKLLERTGPMFGVAVLVEEAALREYALALLQYFSTPRQRRTSWLCTRRRRSSSRGRRSLSGTACALAAGATSRCRLSRIRPYPHSLARVCAPTHTRARPALVPALAELLARVHTVPGVQLMSCHACGWFIKGNTTQTVPGTAQEARGARA